MHISLPAGYEIASSSTPLLAPGTRAYNITTPPGQDPPLLVQIWVYAAAPPGSSKTALDNALGEEHASVFSSAATSTSLEPRTISGRSGWQRQLSSCAIDDMLQLLYIELGDGSIVRLAIYKGPAQLSSGIQRATFEAMVESIAFDGGS
jgi:hypothetical protein